MRWNFYLQKFIKQKLLHILQIFLNERNEHKRAKNDQIFLFLVLDLPYTVLH